MLGLLTVGSLGLKAAAGPPRDGLMDVNSSRVEQRIAGVLAAQGFAVHPKTFAHRSTLLEAARGSCRLAARDARDGVALATAYARDTATIGPVHYLYRGTSHDRPPVFAMRVGRIRTELLSRLGLRPRAAMPVAIAASAECGGAYFGLEDVRI